MNPVKFRYRIVIDNYTDCDANCIMVMTEKDADVIRRLAKEINGKSDGVYINIKRLSD